jgi:hypothetical protein
MLTTDTEAPEANEAGAALPGDRTEEVRLVPFQNPACCAFLPHIVSGRGRGNAGKGRLWQCACFNSVF